MDLFGAAVMGVDPKTGSYLSKEQRVAMFRASRGQGGSVGGGGSNVPGGGAKSNVQPTSAIVVANKMAGIVQSLSKNYAEGTQGVAEQVARNKQNLEDLYNAYNKDKDSELKQEKAETKAVKKRKEGLLRGAKEKMVEGMSKTAAGLMEVGKKAADKISKPVMGFLDKIKKALMFLVGGFIIQNLPTILEQVEKFTDHIANFKDEWQNSIGQVRGVWSILDNVLKSITKRFSGLIKKAGDVGKYVIKKTGEIASKIFKPVKDFLGELLEKTISSFKRAFGALLKKLKDLIPPGLRPKPAVPKTPKLPAGGKTPELPSGTKALPGAADDAVKGGTKNIFQQGMDWLGNTSKNLMSKGKSALKGMKGSISSGLDSVKGMVKPASDAMRMQWLDDAIKPIGKVLPGALKGMGNMMKSVMRIVPGLGFAIDLALNKGVSGQGWTEAIIRGLGSSITGGLSAAAGASMGGSIGAGIGTVVFPVVGTAVGGAIGAALGAIIAGMAGGWAGDQVGAATYEFVTGEKRTEAKGVAPTVPTTAAEITSDSQGHTTDVNMKISDLTSKAFDGPSTPSGMQMKDAFTNSFNVVEMPTKIVDLSKKEEAPEPTPAQLVHDLFTRDPDMDAFRALSAHEYQLVN